MPVRVGTHTSTRSITSATTKQRERTAADTWYAIERGAAAMAADTSEPGTETS